MSARIAKPSGKIRFNLTDAAIATALRLNARGVRHEDIADVLKTTWRVVQYELNRPKRAPTRVDRKPATLRRYSLPKPKHEIAKLRPCLGGCGKMWRTTKETRQCPSCRNSPVQSCGYW